MHGFVSMYNIKNHRIRIQGSFVKVEGVIGDVLNNDKCSQINNRSDKKSYREIYLFLKMVVDHDDQKSRKGPAGQCPPVDTG